MMSVGQLIEKGFSITIVVPQKNELDAREAQSHAREID